MPAVLKIDPQRRIVLSTFYGEVTGAELLRHRETIATDPDFDPNFADVVDFTGVTHTAFSEKTVVALAASPSLFDPASPHVIVAPNDLPFQLAMRFREIAGSGRQIVKIVRSMQEAYEMLAGE